jgi:hypothetical protein
MILAVWWLGVRRLNGRLPAVGHVPGAGVDGHGNLLAGGHGVGTVASTQSERTSVAAPYGFATDRRFCAGDSCVNMFGQHAQINQLCITSRPLRGRIDRGGGKQFADMIALQAQL